MLRTVVWGSVSLDFLLTSPGTIAEPINLIMRNLSEEIAHVKYSLLHSLLHWRGILILIQKLHSEILQSHGREITIEQESPPAWTQEAYRPQEGARCWPPPPPSAGPEQPPPPRWLDLTPPPPLAGPDPPHRLDLTPPPPAGPDPPISWTWPPLTGWTWPPPVSWTWPPPNWTWPPPGVDWQTKWNYYLPVVQRTRAVIINVEVRSQHCALCCWTVKALYYSYYQDPCIDYSQSLIILVSVNGWKNISFVKQMQCKRTVSKIPWIRIWVEFPNAESLQ